MKLVINPTWSFEETVDAAYEAYTGVGITSRGYRNSVLMAWGNIVGKRRALDDLSRLIDEYGGKKALAEAMGVSYYSLRKIEKHFHRLPEPLSVTPAPLKVRMVLNQTVPTEEDRENEFKEITANNRNPVRTILNTVDEYAVAYLNSEGGRILWGITDDSHTVTGVSLTLAQRDELMRGVNGKIAEIQPAVDPTAFRIYLHPIYDEVDQIIVDLFVVEVDVPKSNSSRICWTSGNKTFVRVEGVTQKLSGPAIQDWIEHRQYKLIQMGES